MAERVVLHVGAMKSGTSYVQRLLATNSDALRERGVLFPGRTWRAQVKAVADVLDRQRVVAAPPEGAWDGLVAELAAWPGVGIVSMEFLGPAGAAKIERVVGSFPVGTVDVVITARDLSRGVPAMWQETLKNGRTRTFAEYVAAIEARDKGPGLGFWREQGVARMCRRWSEAVGADRVHLVTVPPPGAPSGELWSRFAAAAGIAGDGVEQPPPANESLGAASAEVLRRVNLLLEDMPYGDFAPLVKHQLAQRVMGARKREEPAVGFEPPEWLVERSADMVERLAATGVTVHGDLADLAPAAVPGVDPASVDHDTQLEAAIASLAGVLQQQAEQGAGRGRRRGAD